MSLASLERKQPKGGIMANPINYSWDLGFDYSTAPGSTGLYNLLMGFQANGSPVDPVNGGVTIGNNLFFHLFNIGPSGTYTFSDVTIQFSSTGANACPFTSTQQIPLANGTNTKLQLANGLATILVGSSAGQIPNGPSAIFVPGTGLPAWSVVPVVPMSLPGTFQLTILISITGPDGNTKIFTHDPEMVVGGAG
jgi:hypothetical protein